MPKITCDVVTEAYIKTRNEIKELESKISELKELQGKREDWLAQQLQAVGAENLKTHHGTIYTTIFESCTVADSDAFIEWVKDNNKFEFLERRVSQAEVLHMMGDREDGGRPNNPPPGIDYKAIRKIGVRKS